MVEKTKRKSTGHHHQEGNKGAKKKVKTEEEVSSSVQKRQLKKERQSHRRHADTVVDAKVLWNKLREKSNTPKDTKELMEQVMTLIRGKVNEIALQHDASRVVQAAIQFGNEEQRKELLKEICAEGAAGLAELSKIQYAHFICLKVIKYCNRDPDCLKMIVRVGPFFVAVPVSHQRKTSVRSHLIFFSTVSPLQGFKGSIPKMAVHSVAARVVESLFLELPSKSTLPLKLEFYGPHVSLFINDIKTTPTLKSSLESATTDTQKDAILKFVKETLAKGMTKSFYGYAFFQELFAEYLEVADPSDIRTMASSVADHSIHLLSTRAGSRVVAICASYATPKDRKRICKSLKGYTASSLLHKDAYLALLRLIQVTDDTVSISKSVLNEILTAPSGDKEQEGKPHQLLELALSEFGSKLFLMLFVEDDEARSKYFDPYERSILEVEATVKENGKQVPTSKKDPALRREELRAQLTESLQNLCTEHTTQLLKSLPGSRVLKEIYCATASESVAAAVIAACEKGLSEGWNVFEDVVGHRTIKNMILSDEEREKPVFAQAFYEAFSERLADVVQSNRGAFVVSALLKVPSVQDKATKKLKSMRKRIKDLSLGDGPTAGYEALAKVLST